jgi:NitT/TauT family transport system substrate-binding protein
VQKHFLSRCGQPLGFALTRINPQRPGVLEKTLNDRDLSHVVDRALHRSMPLRLGVVAATFLTVPLVPVMAQGLTINVGHFPNITHVQALVARSLERQGRGWFEGRLGPGIKIAWYAFNAGPSAMEAIFAQSLDLTYVGPSPAINAYARSGGQEIRIVAGAVTGGSALVVQPDEGLGKAADFRGKRIATPQFGNTQDVAARAWLRAGGLQITQSGDDAQVVPTSNPDQLALFKTRQIDAVWTVEPWVSRLELEAGGKVLVADDTAITTVLVARAEFLSSHTDLVRRLVVAHRDLTEWIQQHPDEAQGMVRAELKAQFKMDVAPELVARAWARMKVTSDISPAGLQEYVNSAQEVGFLRSVPDLSRLVQAP